MINLTSLYLWKQIKHLSSQEQYHFYFLFTKECIKNNFYILKLMHLSYKESHKSWEMGQCVLHKHENLS